MTDDLVRRLREYHELRELQTCAEAADAIDRLTRERDEAHQRYVDANEARIDAEESLTVAYMAGAADARKERDSARVTMSEALRQADAAIARAEAAERKVEKLREALKPFAATTGSETYIVDPNTPESGWCAAWSYQVGHYRRARAVLAETEVG